MDWKLVRKILAFFLAWLMLNPCGPLPGFAKAEAPKDARRAQAVKAAVLKLGAGKDARVLLTLRDSHELAGYVDQASEDSFSVSNFCTGQVAPIGYERVRGLRGLNVATGTKVSAGAGGKLKGTANLAAADPCGTTIIQAKRKGRPGETIFFIGMITFLVVVVVIYVVADKS
jgi:hypothetical protein